MVNGDVKEMERAFLRIARSWITPCVLWEWQSLQSKLLQFSHHWLLVLLQSKSQPRLQVVGKRLLGSECQGSCCGLSSALSLRDELGGTLVPSASQHQPEHPCHRYKIISNPSAAYLMEGEGWAWPFVAPFSPESAGSHQFVVIWESESAAATSSEKMQFNLKVTLRLPTFRGERCLSD